jgi:hypothetical protein
MNFGKAAVCFERKQELSFRFKSLLNDWSNRNSDFLFWSFFFCEIVDNVNTD